MSKYQEKNKTDKYILNILEHNHLQNTMFTLLHIFMQELHDINSIYCVLMVDIIPYHIESYRLQIKCNVKYHIKLIPKFMLSNYTF